MLEVYKPHTNREAVGVWLCSAAKRPSERSALVILKSRILLTYHINCDSSSDFFQHIVCNDSCILLSCIYRIWHKILIIIYKLINNDTKEEMSSIFS